MTLSIWLCDRDDGEGRRGSARVAMKRLVEVPQLVVEVLSSLGDHMIVQVMRGDLDDPTAILYVEKRGEFEVTRVEQWPTVGGAPRVLLTLRAWPTR